jgi:prepilin-type N-terminal cleavage/methylation domain-containing protein
MKLISRHGISTSLRSRRLAAGFTLAELMIAIAVFTFLVGAMVCIQIFGLRVQTLAATKLMATTAGRQTMNMMRDQIRAAQQVYVGTFTNSSFTQASGQQIGNAVQIFTSTNTASTNFVVFYDDPSTNEIFCYTNTPNNVGVVAQYQTNYYCFQAENYQGNILTNYQNNPVIRVTLSFSQWEYPIGFVGANAVNAYDYYFLRTRITRRCKE